MIYNIFFDVLSHLDFIRKNKLDIQKCLWIQKLSITKIQNYKTKQIVKFVKIESVV